MNKKPISTEDLKQLMELSRIGVVNNTYTLEVMGISSDAEEILVREMEKDTLYSCIEKGTSSPVMRKGNSYKKAYKAVQDNPELLATYFLMPSSTPPEYDQWALYFAAKDIFESLQGVSSDHP
jgi:hypothetical protein